MEIGLFIETNNGTTTSDVTNRIKLDGVFKMFKVIKEKSNMLLIQFNFGGTETELCIELESLNKNHDLDFRYDIIEVI